MDTHEKENSWRVFFTKNALQREFTEENWMVMVFRSVPSYSCLLIHTHTQQSLNCNLTSTKYVNIREWRSRQCAVSEKKETRNRIAHQTLGNVVRGDWIIRIRFFLWYSDERVAAAAFIRYCWKCRIFRSPGWSSSTSITPASTFKVNSFHHFTHFHYNWGEPETSRWVDLLESDAKKSEKRKFTSKNTRYWIMEMQCTWKVAKKITTFEAIVHDIEECSETIWNRT